MSSNIAGNTSRDGTDTASPIHEDPADRQVDSTTSAVPEEASEPSDVRKSSRGKGVLTAEDEEREEAEKVRVLLMDLHELSVRRETRMEKSLYDTEEDPEEDVDKAITSLITEHLPSQLKGLLKLDHVRATLGKGHPDFDGVWSTSDLLKRLYGEETLRHYLWESIRKVGECQSRMDNSIQSVEKSMRTFGQEAGLDGDQLTNLITEQVEAQVISKSHLDLADALGDWMTIAELYASSMPQVLSGYVINGKFGQTVNEWVPNGPTTLSNREFYEWSNLNTRKKQVEASKESKTELPRGYEFSDADRETYDRLSLRGRFSGELVRKP